MDGASKFVRGDAIAGIIITVVNVIGGILIGFFQKDMLISDALQTYTILSIGDGLVTQIPSIIVSIAAGILVLVLLKRPILVNLLENNLLFIQRQWLYPDLCSCCFQYFFLKLFGLFHSCDRMFRKCLHSLQEI